MVMKLCRRMVAMGSKGVASAAFSRFMMHLPIMSRTCSLLLSSEMEKLPLVCSPKKSPLANCPVSYVGPALGGFSAYVGHRLSCVLSLVDRLILYWTIECFITVAQGLGFINGYLAVKTLGPDYA